MLVNLIRKMCGSIKISIYEIFVEPCSKLYNKFLKYSMISYVANGSPAIQITHFPVFIGIER
jgi:hypothetical protein